MSPICAGEVLIESFEHFVELFIGTFESYCGVRLEKEVGSIVDR